MKSPPRGKAAGRALFGKDVQEFIVQLEIPSKHPSEDV